MIDKLLSGRRVLVVEDEMLVLMSIEDMLADLGCESVAAAATVDQALALIDAQVFDAAMLDMNLNGTKSFPVADKLAALGVPFVFSTGYSAQDMRDGYGDRPLLKKPIRCAELAGVFACLLSRPSGAVGQCLEASDIERRLADMKASLEPRGTVIPFKMRGKA